MKAAIISFTRTGDELGVRIMRHLKKNCIEAKKTAAAQLHESVSAWTRHAFEKYDVLIYIGAAAIAVRSIAPYLRDKFADPAVLVIDEKGQYVIPILSGHVGGANELAVRLAGWMDAVPVITTATDIQGRFAVDVFARKNNLVLTDRYKAKQISVDILDKKALGIYIGEGIEFDIEQLPEGLYLTDQKEESRIIIDYCGSFGGKAREGNALWLIPQNSVWLGIGCKKGTDGRSIEDALRQLMTDYDICPVAVAGMASIDVKSEEEGLLKVCRGHGWAFKTFSAEKLKAQKGSFTSSEFVLKNVGVDNVCERAAVCAAGAGSRLIIRKLVSPGITLAAAGSCRRISFE
ncbi:MAG: cobalt-precorrin 5A hydrolase [Coprococcus sp.]